MSQMIDITTFIKKGISINEFHHSVFSIKV